MIRPFGCGWVKGDQVEKNIVRFTAGRPPLRSDGISLDLVRQDMIVVPKLRDAPIRETGKRGSGRSLPIGESHRLPNGKDSHVCRRMLLKKLLHGGGPPQTCTSSW